MIKGKEQLRYFSPVSRPDDHGRIELVLRYESHGLVSNYFKAMKPGQSVRNNNNNKYFSFGHEITENIIINSVFTGLCGYLSQGTRWSSRGLAEVWSTRGACWKR